MEILCLFFIPIPSACVMIRLIEDMARILIMETLNHANYRAWLQLSYLPPYALEKKAIGMSKSVCLSSKQLPNILLLVG